MPRRRTADSLTVNPSNMSAPLSKKRKRSLQYNVSDMCHELYDTIRNHRAADSRITCEPFIRLPKKRTSPDYYEVIANPIDLLRIQQKIKMDEYEDVDQLTADMELMCSNAKLFYKKNSQEYRDAGELWDIFLHTRNYLLNENYDDASSTDDYITRRRSNRMRYEDEESNAASDLVEGEEEMMIGAEFDKQAPATEGDDRQGEVTASVEEEELEELFSSVMLAKDDDRQISTMFQLLPSKSKYSEYYDVIKEPIDLKIIAEKIQEKVYRSLEDVERDIMLMVKNAKIFNEPGSQIYKDAEMLKKVTRAKKQEIENRRSGAVKTSERLRSRERLVGQKLSAVCASLRYLEDDEDSSSDAPTAATIAADDDDDSGDEGNITEDKMVLWLLYNMVITYHSPNGVCLAEPFMKLPNRRFHPDYYKEIKHPLSLLNIRKKLKQNDYGHVDQLVSDLDLVFDNAKWYNRDESVLFKNATQLQKVMREKRKELETSDLKDFSFDVLPPIYDCPLTERWADEDEGYTGRTKGKSRRSAYPLQEDRRRTIGKRSTVAGDDVTKKRISELFKTVYDYVDDSGRELRTIFMGLPSKKDYPDYYKVISQPIDLQVISSKIRASQYEHEHELMADLELMFKNARHYNEENSQVYKDAEVLQQAVKRKRQSYYGQESPKKSSPFKMEKTNSLATQLSTLLTSIRDYTDSHGRVLSTPFMKLPLKSEYPDYYEVIKKPIDLQRIQQKQQSGSYESCEDMVSDFVQMFDNACKYNEPDSLIYKDALALQRICLEKKAEMCEEGRNGPPDVRGIIQELMTNLFISVYNHEDEEGRCYADSFMDVPSRHESDDPQEKAMTFDQVKWNLEKGRYRRMDRFQEDMFKVFERTRHLTRTDSQAYEDCVELQLYYMKVRDELCKNGEILLTPALSYTEKHLSVALEKERKEKCPLEANDDEKIRTDDIEPEGDSSTVVKYNDQTYSVGDFVYIQPRDRMLEPHIVHIDRLFKDQNSEWNLFGYWYYRPNETFHPATRKFLEKEVFRADASTSTSLSQVVGRCYVMFVKDYFKYMPQGYEEKDVYVCESRYMQKLKLFKKIKNWSVVMNEDIPVMPRVIPLVPQRVASVFVDSKAGDSYELGDGGTALLDKIRQNVCVENNSEDNQFTYYEQYNCPSGALKLGDCVYVRSHDDRPYVARIDKLWTDTEGAAFFFGPWFVRPDEVDHPPTRLFYHHELFLSSIEDTNSVSSILGKCSVLYYKDYCSSRITEVPEDHVYICECKYLESERVIKKLGKGLKKYVLSAMVTDDEIYFFRHPIIPHKEPSPLLIQAADEFPDATNVSQIDITDALIDEYAPDPERARRRKKTTNKKTLSGYIVFAGVTRRKIQTDNPTATFGDISRIVGQRWRALTREEKERFEEKAKKMAAEQLANQETEAAVPEVQSGSQDGACMSPGPSQEGYMQGHPYSHGFPYNTPSACPVMPPYPPGYIAGSHPYPTHSPNISPAPGSLAAYHPQAYMGVAPRGPNIAHTAPMMGTMPFDYSAHPPRPPSPMFVTVPAKTQRLLHSEAYLRYIEGLRPDSHTVGDWHKSFLATQDNTPVKPGAALPSEWLAQGAGFHDSVVQALWALRDLMMKDTLNIVRSVPFESL